MPEIRTPPAINKELAKELERFKGKWVAVALGHVVGSGTSADKAKQAALKNGETDPLIFRVSAHPERLNLF
ncbi:MAG TPA: DUF5678 domain-containing protein [Burkholderiales bacterium]|nr:DUF5678 domain-containing protein [Burkholderiales bacterium]